MKTTSTLKSLLGASLLVMAGYISVMAQSNSITAPNSVETSITSTGMNYQLSISENVTKSGTRYGLTVGSTLPGVTFKEVDAAHFGNLLFDVYIPVGTPLGTNLFIQVDGQPFWHVTVADILGHNEDPNEDVAFRPVYTPEDAPGTGNNSNSISQPTVVSTGNGATSALTGNKGQPKIDLYPNPATDQILIVTEGEVLWGVSEVIDLSGKKILEIPSGINTPSNGVDRLTLVISSLKPGTYFVRFRTNKDVYTKRFQVIR